MNASPVLELRKISKRFGAVQALSDVDFEVYADEVVALVGDNGAGKSTLVKTLAGVHKPDTGAYVFDGREVTVNSPYDATELGVETVYQDLALCDNLDVVSNLFLGREYVVPAGPRPLHTVREVAMEERARSVLEDLHVRIPNVRIQIANLSGGQRQSVAVARAVMWNSKVVLLDEPTAALGVEQTHQVKELIKRLRDKGLGVVVISHNMSDVFDVADRVIVMRLGRRVATFNTAESSPQEVIGAITGANIPQGAAA